MRVGKSMLLVSVRKAGDPLMKASRSIANLPRDQPDAYRPSASDREGLQSLSNLRIRRASQDLRRLFAAQDCHASARDMPVARERTMSISPQRQEDLGLEPKRSSQTRRVTVGMCRLALSRQSQSHLIRNGTRDRRRGYSVVVAPDYGLRLNTTARPRYFGCPGPLPHPWPLHGITSRSCAYGADENTALAERLSSLAPRKRRRRRL